MIRQFLAGQTLLRLSIRTSASLVAEFSVCTSKVSRGDLKTGSRARFDRVAIAGTGLEAALTADAVETSGLVTADAVGTSALVTADAVGTSGLVTADAVETHVGQSHDPFGTVSGDRPTHGRWYHPIAHFEPEHPIIVPPTSPPHTQYFPSSTGHDGAVWPAPPHRLQLYIRGDGALGALLLLFPDDPADDDAAFLFLGLCWGVTLCVTFRPGESSWTPLEVTAYDRSCGADTMSALAEILRFGAFDAERFFFVAVCVSTGVRP
jgi:hypothetical protein